MQNLSEEEEDSIVGGGERKIKKVRFLLDQEKGIEILRDTLIAAIIIDFSNHVRKTYRGERGE